MLQLRQSGRRPQGLVHAPLQRDGRESLAHRRSHRVLHRRHVVIGGGGGRRGGGRGGRRGGGGGSGSPTAFQEALGRGDALVIVQVLLRARFGLTTEPPDRRHAHLPFAQRPGRCGAVAEGSQGLVEDVVVDRQHHVASVARRPRILPAPVIALLKCARTADPHNVGSVCHNAGVSAAGSQHQWRLCPLRRGGAERRGLQAERQQPPHGGQRPPHGPIDVRTSSAAPLRHKPAARWRHKPAARCLQRS